MIRKSEQFSTYSHLTGAILLVFGTIVLMFQTYGKTDLFILSIIYGTSSAFSMTASAVYHSQKKEENAENIWRKLDHIAIFFIIAGNFTVFGYVYLTGTFKIVFISILWGSVFFGLFFKLFWLNAPRILCTGIYGMMILMIFIPIKTFIHTMNWSEGIMLILGFFSILTAGIIYTKKKPNPRPGVFGFHEIFHIFVLLTILFLYIAVYIAINKAIAI